MPEYPPYTVEDMKVLGDISKEGSPTQYYLEEIGYDPERFRTLLENKRQKSTLHILFEMPLKDILKYVNKKNVSGYVEFRLKVRK